MAHWRRGEADRARGFFDRAVAWTRKYDPSNAELLEFWREAAAPWAASARCANDSRPLPDLPADVFAS